MSGPPTDALPAPDPHAFDIARLASGQTHVLLAVEEHHCRWPVGAPDLVNHRFCCLPKVPGLPYCEHHAVRASEAPKPVKPVPTTYRHIEGHTTIAATVQEFLEPAT